MRNVGQRPAVLGPGGRRPSGWRCGSAIPFGYLAAVVLMGPAFARFAILGHEAAHRLLFTNKRANDVVGRWLVAYPAFVRSTSYRRSHFAHHKEEFGPNEPDMKLYVGYPITRASASAASSGATPSASRAGRTSSRC